MKKLIVGISIFILLNFISAVNVSANVRVMTESARLVGPVKDNSIDLRSNRLRSYLKSHNSPLTDYADEFVLYADEYNLDWRLVPAITGVESTFGKRIPNRSYNAYGWANGNYRFGSWENSIEHVNKTLREKYYDRGADTLPKIARRYAPPSNSWGWKVEYFMNKIDPIPLEFDL